MVKNYPLSYIVKRDKVLLPIFQFWTKVLDCFGKSTYTGRPQKVHIDELKKS